MCSGRTLGCSCCVSANLFKVSFLGDDTIIGLSLQIIDGGVSWGARTQNALKRTASARGATTCINIVRTPATRLATTTAGRESLVLSLSGLPAVVVASRVAGVRTILIRTQNAPRQHGVPPPASISSELRQRDSQQQQLAGPIVTKPRIPGGEGGYPGEHGLKTHRISTGCHHPH